MSTTDKPKVKRPRLSPIVKTIRAAIGKGGVYTPKTVTETEDWILVQLADTIVVFFHKETGHCELNIKDPNGHLWNTPTTARVIDGALDALGYKHVSVGWCKRRGHERNYVFFWNGESYDSSKTIDFSENGMFYLNPKPDVMAIIVADKIKHGDSVLKHYPNIGYTTWDKETYIKNSLKPSAKDSPTPSRKQPVYPGRRYGT